MKNKIKMLFGKNKKQVIIISSSILLILIIVLLVFGKSLSDPNTGYLRNQSVDGLSFENANLTYENGITVFTADVYNETNDIYSMKTINVSFKDKNNKIITLVGYIGNTLSKDEGKYLKISTDQDLSDTVSISYTINK